MYQSLLKTKKVSIHYVQKYLGQDIVWCPGGDQTGEEWEEQLNVFKKLLRKCPLHGHFLAKACPRSLRIMRKFT